MDKNSVKGQKNKGSNSVWFLLCTVASVTLFFKPDFYDPFNSAKLILLLFMESWVIGHLVHSYRSRPIRVKSNEFIFTILIFGFITTLLISTLQTDVFIIGLIGDTQRRNGFISYFALIVVFLFAARSINFSNILRVYKTGILTGVVLSTYGAFQIMGKDFVIWDNPYNVMISTLGNPNFASAMLAVLLLLGSYGMVLKDLPKIFKFLGVYLFGSALAAIVYSDSRQGLLVIFFSLMFYCSAYSFLKNKSLGIFISLICFISSIFAVLGMLQKGPLSPILYKDSISVRGYYWRAGIEMFKESPLTGVGVDRYAQYFKEFRDVGYSLRYGYEITSSNAHNTFIQLFATAGVFVGTLYLALLTFIFVTGITLIRKSNKEDRKIVLGLLATWLGFQAQSLISIDNIGISIWGWLLGGSIIGLRNSKDLSLEKPDPSPSRKKNQVELNLFQPIVSIFILIPSLIFITPFYKVERNMYILKSISDPNFPENKDPVLKYATEVLDNPFADPFYKYRTVFFLFDMGYRDKAYEVLADLLRSDPKNPDFLRGAVAFEESRNNVSNVIALRRQISVIDPWNADNLLQLLKIYKSNGDVLNANAVRDKIISFASGTEIAKTAVEIMSSHDK